MAELEKTEKITINLGLVDLGQIDLLVQEGFYANRTDFIRSAIRTQLATRAAAVEQSVARRTLVLGSAALYPRAAGGAAQGRADGADPRPRSGHHRRRRLPGTRAADDCLGRGAGRVPRQRRGEGGARIAHRLSAQRERIARWISDRLARMFEATRLTSQARLAEATALLQQGSGGGSRLPSMQALLSRLPHGLARMPASVTKPRPGPVAPGRFLDLSYANAAGRAHLQAVRAHRAHRSGRPADRHAARGDAERR